MKSGGGAEWDDGVMGWEPSGCLWDGSVSLRSPWNQGFSHKLVTSVSRVSQVPIDHSDLVADLLKELSNHNERVEERKGALLELLKITREDSLGVWEEHFKTILLLLLETLGDKDVRRPRVRRFPFRGWLGFRAPFCTVLTVYIKTCLQYFPSTS